MFGFDRDMKMDRMIDYIADLKDKHEQLENIVNTLAERVGVLEEQISSLTGEQEDI